MSSPASSPADAASVGQFDAVKPAQGSVDLYSFRESDDGKELIAWALEQFSKCRIQKSYKHQVWTNNLAFVLGHQWMRSIIGSKSDELLNRMKPLPVPKYVARRTINRTRAFVRAEQSKFLSTMPNINVVPATAEEEDVRAAYAGEQVIESYINKRKLRREYSKAVWWMITTGNGFVKDWWDPTTEDPTSGQMGDIVYRSVSPFNIFVPDMREQEIDDQPYIIEARVKTLEWVKSFWGQELKGITITPDQVSSNGLLDDQFYNLSHTPKTELDGCVILEIWVKPGTHRLMPQGGLLVIVGETLVGVFLDGMPYAHHEYPYSKIEHMTNGTFFADSPIVDLKELQREFNDVRTQIGVSAKRMGSPQLLAQKGSIVPGRVTNEPGQIIEYRPGTIAPTPLPLQPLPDYIPKQLEQILTDFEDLSGQHQISKAQAPTGVTAGTALSFLREIDDNFLTPQYQSVEDAFERIAQHTLELFKQFVDQQRKVKVIGLDGAFDTALLSGADIAGGSDVRVEPGSSIGQSQAAKRAAVMDMFSMGIIQDPNQALRLLEVGGAQKVLDTISVAEKKAQRENMKMKALGTQQGMKQLTAYTNQAMEQIVGPMLQDMNAQAAMDPEAQQMDPNTGAPLPPQEITAEDILGNPDISQMIAGEIPPMIPADDFDIHPIHIDVHNRYRMGQEYETLPDPVKAEFDKHVQMHEMLMAQQAQAQMALQGGMVPGAPEDPNAPVGDQPAPPMDMRQAAAGQPQ